MGCGGNCGSCGSGCGGALELTEPELALLEELGQYAFLPVARRADDMTPVYLEDVRFSRESYSLALQLLEKKLLVSIDYDKPLAGMDMSAYKGLPVWGSVALTARGQSVLDTICLRGVEK